MGNYYARFCRRDGEGDFPADSNICQTVLISHLDYATSQPNTWFDKFRQV